jgi:hypothetical protein
MLRRTCKTAHYEYNTVRLGVVVITSDMWPTPEIPDSNPDQCTMWLTSVSLDMLR